MGAFRNFYEHDERLWSAKKNDVLRYWNNLRPDIPVLMTPVQKMAGEKRKGYGEDGLRITGSPQFIAAILSRLKNLLTYENPTTKLRLVFKEVDSPRRSDPSRQSYVFYANLEPRSHGKAGRPLGT